MPVNDGAGSSRHVPSEPAVPVRQCTDDSPELFKDFEDFFFQHRQFKDPNMINFAPKLAVDFLKKHRPNLKAADLGTPAPYQGQLIFGGCPLLTKAVLEVYEMAEAVQNRPIEYVHVV